jgi:hypothetical protein
MNDEYEIITAITVRWNGAEGEGRIQRAARRRLLDAAKDGDVLVLDLLVDAMHEIALLYVESGHQLGCESCHEHKKKWLERLKREAEAEA